MHVCTVQEVLGRLAGAGSTETAPTHKKVKLNTTDPEAVQREPAPSSAPCVELDTASAIADAAGYSADAPFAQQSQLPALLFTASSEELSTPQCLLQQIHAVQHSQLVTGNCYEGACMSVTLGCNATSPSSTSDATNLYADTNTSQLFPQHILVTDILHDIDPVCDTGASGWISESQYDVTPQAWVGTAPQAALDVVAGCSSVPAPAPITCYAVATAEDLSCTRMGNMDGASVAETQGNLADTEQQVTPSPSKRFR